MNGIGKNSGFRFDQDSGDQDSGDQDSLSMDTMSFPLLLEIGMVSLKYLDFK